MSGVKKATQYAALKRALLDRAPSPYPMSLKSAFLCRFYS